MSLFGFAEQSSKLESANITKKVEPRSEAQTSPSKPSLAKMRTEECDEAVKVAQARIVAEQTKARESLSKIEDLSVRIKARLSDKVARRGEAADRAMLGS